MKKALSSVENHPVGPSSVHTTETLPRCWPSVDRSARRSSVRHVGYECPAYPAYGPESSTPTNFKLCILWAIGENRLSYNFIVIFRECWLKIQTWRTTSWWVKKHISICMTQLVSINLDTVQLQIPINYAKSHLWPKSYCLACSLFQRSHWAPSSLGIKTDKPFSVTSQR